MTKANAVKKILSGFVGVIGLLSGAKAFAAADVVVSLQGPANPSVYTTGLYTAVVNNIGNKTANTVTLKINLPQTATSPQIYIMGVLSGIDQRCQVINRVLNCSLGNIARSGSLPISFSFNFPQSTRTLGFSATVTTSSSENSTSNNGASLNPNLAHPSLLIDADRDAINSHCTGTNLSSYFECKTSPSSISQHSTLFHQDGTISIADAPEFTGAFQQSTDGKQLSFQYFENGTPVAEFTGWAVDGSCFEGLTHFLPSSPYVSPYRVCLQ